MKKWTFLTSHAIVLFFLTKDPSITGRELSGLVGITERRVRNIISDLDSAGYIKRSKRGRQVTYKTNVNLPFRHRTQQDKLVRILFEALDRGQIRKQTKKQKSSPKTVL